MDFPAYGATAILGGRVASAHPGGSGKSVGFRAPTQSYGGVVLFVFLRIALRLRYAGEGLGGRGRGQGPGACPLGFLGPLTRTKNCHCFIKNFYINP